MLMIDNPGLRQTNLFLKRKMGQVWGNGKEKKRVESEKGNIESN